MRNGLWPGYNQTPFALTWVTCDRASSSGCCTELFRKGSRLLGKRFGLFQITHMTGFFGDLKLTILGGAYKFCFSFPIRFVVFTCRSILYQVSSFHRF
jgi:hypothetical protein